MTIITIDRATVEQALEAMENTSPLGSRLESYDEFFAAIAALRAALAQQAERVEPVGRVVSANCEYATVQWLKQTSDVGGGDPKNSRSWPIAGDAVYTAPPQRKPLTDEEIAVLEAKYAPPVHPDFADSDDWVDLIRAVERAHGIGEGA